MRCLKSCLFFIGLIFIITGTAQAQVVLKGVFTALESCEAYQSFRKGTNPGNIRLVQGASYELIAKNKEKATHYRIRIKDASPMERWVSASCGHILTPDAALSSGHDPSLPEYLLAVSWQPAFCQTHQSRSECKSQNKNRYDADHFTLHGLWPQPVSNVYCTADDRNKRLDEQKKYHQLPEPRISSATSEQLTRVMPGTMSFLHRHEWIKHGTCYSPSPEEYFGESIQLIKQLNDSAVREYFKDNIGETVSVSEIKARFDKAFGPGAGDKVNIKCHNGMITELRINLKGEITLQSELSALIHNAASAASGCRSGIIDAAGY